MKMISNDHTVNIRRWLAATTLALASTAAMAYQHPMNEAMRSCVTAVQSELKLGNYDVIDRRYGFNHVGRKSYDIYFNLKLRDGAGDAAQPMKVRCSSKGFGKVQSIELEEGSWSYRLGAADRG